MSRRSTLGAGPCSFADIRSPPGALPTGHGGIQARMSTQFLLPEVAQTAVDADADDPCTELGTAIEARQALDDLDHHILREIRGIFHVPKGSPADRPDSRLIAFKEIRKC